MPHARAVSCTPFTCSAIVASVSYATCDPDGIAHLRALPNTTLCVGPTDGPVYVFIHGLGMGAHDLIALALSFVRAGHAIALMQLQGHGDTTAAYEKATYWDWLNQIDGVCAPLTATSREVVLVGYSLGATLALDYASTHKVAGVVGISTFFAPRRFWVAHLVLPFARFLGIRRERRFPLTTRLATHKKLSYHRHLSVLHLAEAVRHGDRVRGMRTTLDTPVLFVHSTLDPLASHQAVERYAREHTTDSSLVFVRELSHFLQFDVPSDLLRDVILARLSTQASARTAETEQTRAYLEAVGVLQKHIVPNCVPRVTLKQLTRQAGQA